MEGVEDIPELVMAEGVPWNWESFPEYLEALAARRCDIDFAAQVPHAPLRVFVMGERGVDREPATAADMAAMAAMVEEGHQPARWASPPRARCSIARRTASSRRRSAPPRRN